MLTYTLYIICHVALQFCNTFGCHCRQPPVITILYLFLSIHYFYSLQILTHFIQFIVSLAYLWVILLLVCTWSMPYFQLFLLFYCVFKPLNCLTFYVACCIRYFANFSEFHVFSILFSKFLSFHSIFIVVNHTFYS